MSKKSKEKVTIIERKNGFVPINFSEIWEFRELLWTFSIRDVRVKYKQTFIGILWAIIQPLATMVVFTFFFGKIAKISSEGVPYEIFSYSGLILWMYFSGAISSASNSLVTSRSLITKVYFPRIIVPISATLTGLLDYLVAGSVLLGMMVFFNISISADVFFLPVIIGLTTMLASGVGFWLSAINVKYHDVKHAVPFIIQLGLFITPVIYPISVAPTFKNLLLLNPMTGIIEAHRAIILGHQAINFQALGVSAIITLMIFISGALYFKSVEKYFADLI